MYVSITYLLKLSLSTHSRHFVLSTSVESLGVGATAAALTFLNRPARRSIYPKCHFKDNAFYASDNTHRNEGLKMALRDFHLPFVSTPQANIEAHEIALQQLKVACQAVVSLPLPRVSQLQ